MSELIVTIDNEKFSINPDHNRSVSVNGLKYEIEIAQLSKHTFKIKLRNKIFHITTTKLGNDKYSFLINGHYFESYVRTKLEEEAANILNGNSSNSKENKIKSPMPGLILRVNKNIGDCVEEGESLILLEAMKMENEIKSPVKGIISEIFIENGNSVEKNQTLITIQ